MPPGTKNTKKWYITFIRMALIAWESLDFSKNGSEKLLASVGIVR